MSRSELIQTMTMVLRSAEVDLGDERMVIQLLNSHGFRSGDVIACMDDAIEEARRLGQKLSFNFGGA